MDRMMIGNIIGSVLLVCCVMPVQSASVGDLAPACKAKIVDSGQPLDLTRLRGKVVLLDFWATWCPPCKKSIPFFNQLQTKFGKDGFEIVAINVDENPNDAYQYMQKFPVLYSVALDPVGDCPEKYQVKAMPSSYFIDRQGVIREIHLGFRDNDQQGIIEQVSLLLDEHYEE